MGPEGWGVLAAAPVAGSFVGVLIGRWGDGQPVVWSRYKCEGCGAVLTPRDLVPLISWVLARGRCRHCGYPLGWFYPGVEIAALIVALIALAASDMPRAALDCLFGWWLLTLAWIDLRRWLLPDLLTLPLIVAGLAVAAPVDLDTGVDRAFGAAVGCLPLGAIAAGSRAVPPGHGRGCGGA